MDILSPTATAVAGSKKLTLRKCVGVPLDFNIQVKPESELTRIVPYSPTIIATPCEETVSPSSADLVPLATSLHD
jgi:hypothetical protein